jgi:hypothetical protein
VARAQSAFHSSWRLKLALRYCFPIREKKKRTKQAVEIPVLSEFRTLTPVTSSAPSAPVHSKCHSILYKMQWGRNGSFKHCSPPAMERLNKILAASRQNCELIASCPIRLSRCSSNSYHEARLERK